MPQIHLGVYLTSGNETVDSVRWALEVFHIEIDYLKPYDLIKRLTGGLSRV